MPTFDPVIVYLAQACVAVLFGFSSVSKLRAFGVFRATLQDYELVPPPALGLCAASVVVAEMTVAVGALVPTASNFAMLGACALLLTYVLAIGVNLLRGRRDIDCGCTGPASRQLLSGWLLLRNSVLIALAVIGLAQPAVRTLAFADYALIGLAMLAAMTFYAAMNQLMANAPRLDALDDLMDAA